MSDTKISALSANTTPVSTDITVIVDDPGGTPQSQKITLANLMALFANPVTDDGDSLGTTSLKWSDVFLALGGVIDWGNGAASLESDGAQLIGMVDSGNQGIVPVMHFIRADVVRNLPNDTNENAIFDNPTNGRLTLETGVYRFEGIIAISGMSASAGNCSFDIVGAGTATIDSWLWHNVGTDSTTPANATSMTGTFPITQQSAAGVVNILGTGTGVAWSTRGTFEVTGAGTIIPSVTQANASAAVVSVGSYLEFWRIGATGAVSVGQWD